MDLVAITLGISTAAYFAYLRQPPPLPLSKRKDWLRNYFVLGLNTDGRVADTLWICDPWLGGPFDSSEKTMKKFYVKYFALCVDYYGFSHAGMLCCRKGGTAIYVNAEIKERKCKSLLFMLTDFRNETYIYWNRDGTYNLRTEDTWTIPAERKKCERKLADFNEYRRVLLELTHLLVTNEQVAYVEPAQEVSKNTNLETLQFIWKVITLVIGPALFFWLIW